MPPFSVLNRNICYFFLVKKSCLATGQDYFQTYVLPVVQFPWYNLRMCVGTILPLVPPSYLILGGGLGLWRHVGSPISFLPPWLRPAGDEPSHAGGKLERKWSASTSAKNWQKPQSTPLPLLLPLAREKFKESDQHQHLQKLTNKSPRPSPPVPNAYSMLKMMMKNNFIIFSVSLSVSQDFQI